MHRPEMETQAICWRCQEAKPLTGCEDKTERDHQNNWKKLQLLSYNAHLSLNITWKYELWTINLRYTPNKCVNIKKYLDVHPTSWFLCHQPAKHLLESQSVSLDHSVKPLSSVNFRRASPNFYNLSGYISPFTRLPPIAGSQTLARVIVSLYKLYNTQPILSIWIL